MSDSATAGSGNSWLPPQRSSAAMSFQSAIPWRVALRQSLPPLHRLATILNNPPCRTMIFQRTATTPLTSCLSPRVHSTPVAPPSPAPHPPKAQIFTDRLRSHRCIAVEIYSPKSLGLSNCKAITRFEPWSRETPVNECYRRLTSAPDRKQRREVLPCRIVLLHRTGVVALWSADSRLLIRNYP
jgi:hypothetical protein